MKANELSIGDWVQARIITFRGAERLTPPMRVVSLGETWVQLLIDPRSGDPDKYDIADIRPVPLTVDMLIANDCKTVNTQCFEWKNENDDGLIAAINAEVGNDGIIWAEIWTLGHSLRLPAPYVHKLQHALRLAGIEKEIGL